MNDIIKHRADDHLNIEFLNNINIVTLPSGHILSQPTSKQRERILKVRKYHKIETQT